MGQLLTLMVLGLGTSSNDKDHTSQQRPVGHDAAGRSVAPTQYRATVTDEDDDTFWEDDDTGNDVQNTETTVLGLTTHEMSCDDETAAPDNSTQQSTPTEDGAGHPGEILHQEPPSLDDWRWSVHKHRTGLGEAEFMSSGSSATVGAGREPSEECDQLMLKIASIPDKSTRLRRLQQYLDSQRGSYRPEAGRLSVEDVEITDDQSTRALSATVTRGKTGLLGNKYYS